MFNDEQKKHPTTAVEDKTSRVYFMHSNEIPNPLDPLRVKFAVDYIEEYPDQDDFVKREINFMQKTMNGVYGALTSAEAPFWFDDRSVWLIRQHAAYAHYILRAGRTPRKELSGRTDVVTVQSVTRTPEKDAFFSLLADPKVSWDKKQDFVKAKMQFIEENNMPLAWAVKKVTSHRMAWEKSVASIGIVAVAEALRHPKEAPNLLTITTTFTPAQENKRRGFGLRKSRPH